MGKKNIVYVSIIWHMHQPYYRIPGTNHSLLPWVRMHALKDYIGMLKVVSAFPDVHLTFNFTPCLLEQLNAYVSGNATDTVLELSQKPAHNLTVEDKVRLLDRFFRCHQGTMVKPYPRYSQLLDKRGQTREPHLLKERLSYFSESDLLDLQVWYNLTWFHPAIREEYPLVQALLNKGRNFTEDEKRQLLNLQKTVMSSIIPEYKKALERGQVELSLSPYFHPILPLLIDTDLGRAANHSTILPVTRFQYPLDARQHIQQACAFYKDLFGVDPKGMWPSEGSVSQHIVSHVAESGIKWIATDEGILAKSLGVPFLRKGFSDSVASPLLYRSYRVNEGQNEIAVVFRDHTLSDLIGFVYSTWEPQKAVDDFFARLQVIRESYVDQPHDPIVFIILDGENAWEYYPNNGVDFLNLFYGALQSTPWVRPTSVSEYLALNEPTSRLKSLEPGSWINANFNIWIGNKEKNKAWELLTEARQDAQREPEESKKIEGIKALMPAEGSDWFWWFGDDHYTEEKEAFDTLLRKYLAHSYSVRGKQVPPRFLEPISVTARTESEITTPTAFISPKITGRINSYFEWLAAGSFEEKLRFSSIHPSQPNIIKKVFYGYNLENLFIRLDPCRKIYEPGKVLLGTLLIHFTYPNSSVIRFQFTAEPKLKLLDESLIPAPQAAYEEIFEIAIPFAALNVSPGQNVDFYITLNLDHGWIERYPAYRQISFQVPKPDFEQMMWSAL